MVTMQQVADRAKVSISTVSFVVNNTKPVTPQTRERILQAIDELGYRRNAMARALASRRSRMLALLYPVMEHNLNEQIASAAAAAASHGYNLVLWPIHKDNAKTEVTSLIKAGFADGILLMEVKLTDERVDRLREVGAAFALIGRTEDPGDVDYVDIDFEQTTLAAIDHLAKLDHRNIALVVENFEGTPLAGYSPPVRTVTAFEQEMHARGLPGAVFRTPRSAKTEQSLADDIMREAPETTAVIVMHDEACFGLVNGFKRRNLTIPDDVSIISIASSKSLGSLTDPELTTYNAPGEVLGRLAAEALVARLEGRDGPPMQIRVACMRHDRASVAPAPATALA